MIRNSLLFLTAVLLAGCSPHVEETPLKPIVDVKVARAELAEIRVTVRGPAFVFAREQANIGSRLTAPIRKLLVRKGDSVAAGQVLAQLDNRDLLALRDEASAAVSDAEANLQRVTTGTLPTDIERARGQAVSAEAALNQAQKFYDRRHQLFEQGAIPQRDVLVSETELAQAKSNHEVAKKALDLLKNQSGDKEIVIAKSKVEQAQARLTLIKTQLDFAEIRSTSAGIITEQFMFPGDMAKPDAPLFTIMDLSVAVARAQIPEIEAAGLRPGAACTFIPTDIPGSSFAGRVSVVNQAIDPARRTVESWCDIPNPKRALRAGAYGRLEVVTGLLSNSIVVPITAVQVEEGGKKGVVMVADASRTAVKRAVDLGARVDGQIEIRTGLKAGETVIIEGGYGLSEGTQVKWP